MNDKRYIGIGSQVTVKSGVTTHTFRITLEAGNIEEQTISSVSPLGRALIGRQAGDSVEVRAPGGQHAYEVVNVR